MQTTAPEAGREYRDPLVKFFAEETQSKLDRPPLHRSRLGRVGYVPAGALDCTVGDVATWIRDGSLRERVGLTGSGSVRVAYNLNLFDWRPWGPLHGANHGTNGGGSISTASPSGGTGMCMVLRGDLGGYRAWLWTLATEREEGVYLTRRRAVRGAPDPAPRR